MFVVKKNAYILDNVQAWSRVCLFHLCSLNQSVSLQRATAGSPDAPAARTMGILAPRLLHDKERRGAGWLLLGVAGYIDLLCPSLEGEGWYLWSQVTPFHKDTVKGEEVCVHAVVALCGSCRPPLPASEDAKLRGFKCKDILSTPLTLQKSPESFSGCHWVTRQPSPSRLLPPPKAKSKGMCSLNSVVRFLFIGPAGFSPLPHRHTRSFTHLHRRKHQQRPSQTGGHPTSVPHDGQLGA